jgi:hypothetical protein
MVDNRMQILVRVTPTAIEILVCQTASVAKKKEMKECTSGI